MISVHSNHQKEITRDHDDINCSGSTYVTLMWISWCEKLAGQRKWAQDESGCPKGAAKDLVCKWGSWPLYNGRPRWQLLWSSTTTCWSLFPVFHKRWSCTLDLWIAWASPTICVCHFDFIPLTEVSASKSFAEPAVVGPILQSASLILILGRVWCKYNNQLNSSCKAKVTVEADLLRLLTQNSMQFSYL